jgi:hypothetical protein
MRSRVGLRASNLFAAASDVQLADLFMLARIDRILKSPKHSRETMQEFKTDWALLNEARANRATAMAGTVSTPNSATEAKKNSGNN